MESVSFSKYQASYNACPRCQSTDLDGDSIQVDANVAWQSVWCISCGLSWTDEYVLSAISNVYDDTTGQDIELMP